MIQNNLMNCARQRLETHPLTATHNCYEKPLADKYLSNLKLLARSTQANFFLFRMPH